MYFSPGHPTPAQDPPRGTSDQAIQQESLPDLPGPGPQLGANQGHEVAGPGGEGDLPGQQVGCVETPLILTILFPPVSLTTAQGRSDLIVSQK